MQSDDEKNNKNQDRDFLDFTIEEKLKIQQEAQNKKDIAVGINAMHQRALQRDDKKLFQSVAQNEKMNLESLSKKLAFEKSLMTTTKKYLSNNFKTKQLKFTSKKKKDRNF